MQIFLELSGHPKANIKRVVLAGNTVIGRSKKCGLQIASASVSRKHCEIRLGETLGSDGATVVDLGSSNGTYLDSERLAAGEEHPLQEGSRLNIGGIRFLVSYQKSAVAPAPEPAEAEALPGDVAATAAAAAPIADDVFLGDDEPLPLDDDEDLLGFDEEPVGEPLVAEATNDPESASIPGEDESLESGATREVQIDDAADDAILGGDSLILADDDEAILFADDDDAADEGASRLEFLDVAPPSRESAAGEPDTEASVGRSEEENSVEQDDLFEEAEKPADGAARADDPILGDPDEEEPILLSNDELDAAEHDSQTFFSADPQGASAAAPADEHREENQDDDEDDIAAAALADDEPLEDEPEPVHGADEDEAFAFLDDDEGDKSKSKAKANDSQLGDFLSQMGRD